MRRARLCPGGEGGAAAQPSGNGLGNSVEDVLPVTSGLHLLGQPVRCGGQITAVACLVQADERVAHGWRHGAAVTANVQRGAGVECSPDGLACIPQRVLYEAMRVAVYA